MVLEKTLESPLDGKEIKLVNLRLSVSQAAAGYSGFLPSPRKGGCMVLGQNLISEDLRSITGSAFSLN